MNFRRQRNVLPLIALASWSLLGCGETATIRVGLVRGQLGPCPDSPNCVNSLADPADTTHYIDPIAYPEVGTQATSADVLDQVAAVLATWARTTIETRNDRYMHVRAVSLVMRFVDDMELLLDDSQRVIHVRSASRAGYSDLGVNRKRVERLRSDLADLATLTDPTDKGQ